MEYRKQNYKLIHQWVSMINKEQKKQ